MNPKVAEYVLKVLAAAIEARNSGVPADLKDKLEALIAEGRDSILEPQDDGSAWTEDAILAWKAAHDAEIAEIRSRHSADGTGAP